MGRITDLVSLGQFWLRPRDVKQKGTDQHRSGCGWGAQTAPPDMVEQQGTSLKSPERHRNKCLGPFLPGAFGRWYFRRMSLFRFWEITKELQHCKDLTFVPGFLGSSLCQEAIIFTLVSMA